MRISTILLLAVLGVGSAIAETTIEKSAVQEINPMIIQGIWKGFQPLVKDSVAFVFYSQNRGKSFAKGQLVSVFTYAVDYTKKPIQLDMMQKQGKNMAILAFQGRDTLFMKMGSNNLRPESFATGFDSLACILIRVPQPGQDSILNR